VINVWSRGISPFNIMRWGPGHLFFRKYAGRYKALPWFTEIGRFKDYLHSNWTGNHVSAGGYAHITLLAAAGFAHEPLRHRVPHLTQTKSLRMIYGEKDWMDPTHGFALRDELVAASSSPTDPLRVEVATVLQGGHNIVLENPTGTIEALLAALGDATFNDGVYTGLWSPPPPIVVDLATPA
jgi:pimeloyl-ACP methyl ester carboxylesterase